jgi:hypothetical protein
VVRKDVEAHEETYVRLGRTWFLLAQAEVVRPRSVITSLSRFQNNPS